MTKLSGILEGDRCQEENVEQVPMCLKSRKEAGVPGVMRAKGS